MKTLRIRHPNIDFFLRVLVALMFGTALVLYMHLG